MAGYATKLIAICSGVKTAVAGITAVNGYDVAVKTTTADVWESPFDRSAGEFPRAYVYLKPDDSGSLDRVDMSAFDARYKIDVDIWVHCQDQTDLDNLPKYTAAIIYAVEAWRLSSSIGSEMDFEPTNVSYHHLEKKKSVVRVSYSGAVRFSRTDR